jgi:uncharacterized damage-inducible protein DinB
MNNFQNTAGRRQFIKSAAIISSGISGMLLLPNESAAETNTTPPSLTIVGPREGYSPQIGTLVSMMDWCRNAVTSVVEGMTTEQLDFLLDDKANTIGALLYHLAATDAFYHEHTFKGVEWDKWDKAVADKFNTAMELGEPARKAIKGNNLDFYISLLKETREKTYSEFKKRDDKWLMTVDQKWFWGPTNNYCKWFHVCEHESHHQGQISLIKSRVPGIKKDS